MKYIVLILASLISLSSYAQSEQATLLSNWTQEGLPASQAHNNTYNEVWGTVVNDREIAIIGSTNGTHFIDITDPVNPSEVAYVAGGTQGTSIIHRDYDDYNGYLYAVADEGNESTLQIIDMSDLPTSVNVVYDSNEILRRTHNIFIDKANARMYTCATKTVSSYAALQIVDISNPTAPVALVEHGSFGGINIGHAHDIYVKDNIGYLNCGPDALFVVDFTDAVNPVMQGTLTSYPDRGYNHSGWLADDGETYYFADEDHGYDIKICNVSDPSDMEVSSTFNAESAEPAFSIPHNLIVHGDRLYTSYYYDGLQVYDISTPTAPVRIFHYDTYPGASRDRYEGAWGIYPFMPSGNILLSDMQSGLFVFSMEASTAVDVIEGTELSVTVSPQPAKDKLQISFNSELSEDMTISLFDIQGKEVKQYSKRHFAEGANNFELDIDQNLNSGVYILKMRGEEQYAVQKIIVAK